jgi:hypothetical protein
MLNIGTKVKPYGTLTMIRKIGGERYYWFVKGDSVAMLPASMFEEANAEPFKSGQLTATERQAQYKEMIASRELLLKAISGAAIVGKDGRLRISKKMVDAFVQLSNG